MEVARQPNETYIDYCNRLISAKEKNLIDIDKSEMWELLTGEVVSSCESRKRLYGVKAFLKQMMTEEENKITDNAVIKKIKQEQQQLAEEKVKFRDQRRELNKLINEKARTDYIKECIEETALVIAKEKPLQWSKPAPINSDREGVLLISDWHYGMCVDNFLNIYNDEEFIHRIDALVTKTIQYGKFHGIDTLHVLNLGDLISGLIHVTTRIANTEDTVKQTMHVSEILAEMLVRLASNFNHVKFYNVIDNHSRVVANIKESVNDESFAKFIPWYLKPRMMAAGIDNVEIIDNALDGEIMILDVCGHTCFGVHGHHDKVSQVVQDLSLMTRIFADYVFVSHYHHNIEDEIHSTEIVVNPCLIGVDEFSKDKRKTSKPAQKFMIFNEEEGRECTYSIRLDR